MLQTATKIVKSSFFWLMLAVIFLMCAAATANADTTLMQLSSDDPEGGFLDWVKLNWKEILIVIGIILEALLRLLPTNHNYSIIHFIIRLIDWLVPNKAKGEGSKYKYFFRISKGEETKHE